MDRSPENQPTPPPADVPAPLSTRDVAPVQTAMATAPARGLAAQVFGMTALVPRSVYIATGVVLMALKFGIETLLLGELARDRLTIPGFLSPFFGERAHIVSAAPPGVAWLMIAIALPFLWVGLSMSVRRAVDAGLPPWVGFFFLLPGPNYLVMLALSVIPSRAARAPAPAPGPYREGRAQVELIPDGRSRAVEILRPVLLASALGLGMFGLCVYGFRSYGTALFVLTPLAMGFFIGASFVSSWKGAVGCLLGSFLVIAAALLLFGLEGAVCILMAIVPTGVAGGFGLALGFAMRQLLRSPQRPMLGALCLPLAGGVEAAADGDKAVYEVTTVIEIDAPPDVVWQNVIAFPPLEEPDEALFLAGIAYPKSATIDGEGVGAVRRCNFSTGSFIEPITTWEPGRRLAFDVSDSPPPMRELSPYELVDAPHLDGFMRSKRGEFRLVPLPDGRTRLEGTTWYELEIHPGAYWQLWSDGIVHAVHERVLEHIAEQSEAR